jgi:hypothetical protein
VSVVCCSSCSAPLSRRVQQKIAEGGAVTGLCRPCFDANRRAPERRCVDCGKKIVKRDATRCQLHANRLKAADAELERRRLNAALRAFRRPDVRARHDAANRAMGDRKLRWCPQEHRAEYLRLLKRMPSVQAKAAILAKLTPFERQLQRVLAGATISEKPRLPAREPEFTLGGVSGGWL